MPPSDGKPSVITNYDLACESGDVQVAEENLHYDTQLAGKDFPEMLDLEAVQSSFDWGFEGNLGFTSSPFLETNFIMSRTNQSSEQQILSRQSFSSAIPDPISSAHILRSLAPRYLRDTKVQTSALFLTRILGSYPDMMMRKENFPPFVHSITFAEHQDNKEFFPEALINCMSIAQIFANRKKETNKFMWRTIKMEQEKIWSEVRASVLPSAKAC